MKSKLGKALQLFNKISQKNIPSSEEIESMPVEKHISFVDNEAIKKKLDELMLVVKTELAKDLYIADEKMAKDDVIQKILDHYIHTEISTSIMNCYSMLKKQLSRK